MGALSSKNLCLIKKVTTVEEKRNDFDEFTFEAVAALGKLMTCDKLASDQRTIMKISRMRAWLIKMADELTEVKQPELPFDEHSEANN